MAETKILMEQAIAKWGVESQLDMVIEECSELITSIQHKRRNRIPDIDVCEEGVDVELCLEQLKLILGMPITWESIKEQKLARLETLLKD